MKLFVIWLEVLDRSVNVSISVHMTPEASERNREVDHLSISMFEHPTGAMVQEGSTYSM